LLPSTVKISGGEAILAGSRNKQITGKLEVA
jgi:hypothetical protein